MHVFLFGVLAMCAGCDGISIGDPGLDPPHNGPCSEERFVVVDDLTQPAPGFYNAPNALLEAARGAYDGTLELRDGGKVPVTVQMTLDENTVLAKYRVDYRESTCPHWLSAEVEIAIDAGAVLSGRAMGVITTPDHGRVAKTQISTPLIAFESFHSTLSPPTFHRDVITGPSLSADFTLEDPDTWQAAFNFVADAEVIALGKAELTATAKLGSGVADAGQVTDDAGGTE